MPKRRLETQKHSDVEEGQSPKRQSTQGPEIHSIAGPSHQQQLSREMGRLAFSKDSRDQDSGQSDADRETDTEQARTLRQWYLRTSSEERDLNEDKGHAEAGPSQDTGNIAQVRKNVQYVFKSNQTTLWHAYTVACTSHGEGSQITKDLATILSFKDDKFEGDNQTIIGAIQRIAKLDDENRRIGDAAKIMVSYPDQIGSFCQSDKGEGKERAESDTAQDTSDIAQRKLDFLRKIPDKTILALSTISAKRVDTRKKPDGHLHTDIRDACRTIRTSRGLYLRHHLSRMINYYGTANDEDAARAAIVLKDTLNKEGFSENDKENLKIKQYKNEINQYFQDAGLSEEQT